MPQTCCQDKANNCQNLNAASDPPDRKVSTHRCTAPRFNVRINYAAICHASGFLRVSRISLSEIFFGSVKSPAAGVCGSRFTTRGWTGGNSFRLIAAGIMPSAGLNLILATKVQQPMRELGVKHTHQSLSRQLSITQKSCRKPSASGYSQYM